MCRKSRSWRRSFLKRMMTRRRLLTRRLSRLYLECVPRGEAKPGARTTLTLLLASTVCRGQIRSQKFGQAAGIEGQ